MNVIPAQIAGVQDIVLVTPPRKDGSISPEALMAAELAEVTDVFKLGGAQAVAALAYGTESVPQVDKIVGPGGIFVATAKRKVFGQVAIDMIAGPSEILVLADRKTNPKWAAADLLSQAEHDALASAVLVTDSRELAEAVRAELEVLLEVLPRRDIARRSIEDNGKIIVTDSLDKAVEAVNRIAPEHLELCVDDPFRYLNDVKNAGSIFLGRSCPEAVGDYFAGANHTLLLDVKNRRWSAEMLSVCGVTESQMPKLYESWEAVGTLRPEMAALLGLPESVRVCAGAGDNAAAAVGTGTVGEGRCNISLGTSGTVFISSRRFRGDPQNALHAFAHADGGYHLMGCMLSAASCNKWLMDEIFQTENYAGEQGAIAPEKLGEDRVYFLPYLMGERSPINDTNARGVFAGMSMDTSRADLVQAVLEGVAFAIRDSVEVAKSQGIALERSTVCGGGAKSPLWKTILANVLDLELETTATEQGPGMGGAMLAMVACGEYPDVESVCEKLVTVSARVCPQPELVEKYQRRYEKFRKLYPALKGWFAEE